jgi:hypothetical protein
MTSAQPAIDPAAVVEDHALSMTSAQPAIGTAAVVDQLAFDDDRPDADRPAAQFSAFGVMAHETGIDRGRYFPAAGFSVQRNTLSGAIGFTTSDVVPIAVNGADRQLTSGGAIDENDRPRERAEQSASRRICAIEWYYDIPPGRDYAFHVGESSVLFPAVAQLIVRRQIVSRLWRVGRVVVKSNAAPGGENLRRRFFPWDIGRDIQPASRNAPCSNAQLFKPCQLGHQLLKKQRTKFKIQPSAADEREPGRRRDIHAGPETVASRNATGRCHGAQIPATREFPRRHGKADRTISSRGLFQLAVGR